MTFIEQMRQEVAAEAAKAEQAEAAAANAEGSTQTTESPNPIPPADSVSEITPAVDAPADTEQQPAAENPAPATETPKEWSKDLQQLHQERANWRKEIEEARKKLEKDTADAAAKLEELRKPVAPAATTTPEKDPAVDAKALRAEAKRLRSEARKLADTDPFESQKMLVDAADKADEAAEIEIQETYRTREVVQAEQKAKAEKTAWQSKWEEDHPGVPIATGETLVKDAWAYAGKLKLSGEAARGAAQAYYDMKLPEVTKKPEPSAIPPATKPSPTPIVPANRSASTPAAAGDPKTDSGAQQQPTLRITRPPPKRFWGDMGRRMLGEQA